MPEQQQIGRKDGAVNDVLILIYSLSLLQNQLPSPTNSPYLCRQRNAARQAGDVEAGSLLEAAGASNPNQTVGNGSIVTAAEPTPKNDIV